MRTSSLRRAAAIAVITWAGLGCPPAPSPATSLLGPADFIPKCPDHPFEFEVVVLDTMTHAFTVRTLTSIAVSGDMSSVVEVHDCQRLIVPDPSGAENSFTYGPVATIFASRTLDIIDGRRDSSAAAAIYSWDKRNPASGDYPNLGIEAGWNCLYLFGVGGTVEARMVPALSDSACLKAPKRGAGTVLEARPTPPPAGMSPDDIPPVARWAGDIGNGATVNHIWIRCGANSCEIGPHGFKAEQGLAADAKAQVLAQIQGTPANSRVLEIGGWYDHQRLSNAVSGKLEVGNVLATIIPYPTLGSLDDPTDFAKWQIVAFAYFPQPAGAYTGKLNFEQGISVISLHHGAWGDGAIPAGENVVRPCNPVNNADPWWARIKSPSGVEKFFCVNRWVHSVGGKPLPGTVRWQWLDDDEKTWIRCPKGCCPIA